MHINNFIILSCDYIGQQLAINYNLFLLILKFGRNLLLLNLAVKGLTWHDFCDRVNCYTAPISKVKSHILDRCSYYTIPFVSL